MRKINFQLLITLLLFSSMAINRLFAQPNTWQQKADFASVSSPPVTQPPTRYGAVSFSIGSKGYVGTGATGTVGNLSIYSDFWEFDPLTNTWSQKASFGGGQRIFAVGFELDGKGYVGTGKDANSQLKKDFWQYDPVTNAWTEKAEYPGASRYKSTGFAVNGQGYIGLGTNDFPCSPPFSTLGCLTDFWKYNPNSDVWSSIPDFPSFQRSGAVAFVIGNDAYVGAGGSFVEFYKLNGLTDTWVQIASLPFSNGMTESSSFSVNGKGYIVGGADAWDAALKKVFEYNPGNNTWVTKQDFPGRARAAANTFTIGSDAYYGFGASSASPANNIYDNEINGLWKYTPSNDNWINVISEPVSGRLDAIRFSIGDKGYVGMGYDDQVVDAVNVYYKDLWEFNPSTNAWSQKASLPGSAREKAASFALNEKGYVGAGRNPFDDDLSDFWEYNPTLNNWSSKAAIPSSGNTKASFSLNNKGYVLNEWGDFFEYNPQTNTWGQKTSPNSTGDLAYFTANDKGYLLGDLFEAYNPSNNSWTTLSSPPFDLPGFYTGFGIGNNGYVVLHDLYGVLNVPPTSQVPLWRYNTQSNTWQEMAPFPANRALGIGMSIGNKGYVGFGVRSFSSNLEIGNEFWEYIPEEATENPCTAAPKTPSAISGQSTGVCANTSGSYNISPVIAATGYVWSTTGDITVSSGQGTTEATFDFGPGFTTGTVRVQAENACGLSTVRSLTISSTAKTPGAISGQSTGVCANTSGSYSISPVIAATGYVWSTTGDITVSSGQGTTEATFDFGPGFTTGTVRVQAENACGLSTVRSLTIGSTAKTPGAISGQSTGVCANTSGSYSISPVVAATGYVWSTTGDITVSSGQGTTEATFNFGPGFTTGTVRVQAENACGLSTVKSLTIGSTAKTPGAISGQTTGVCANTSGTYSISPVVAATGYVWSTTGDITVSSGQGTTAATFSFGPGFTTGTVRVQAENACGLSAVKSLTIGSTAKTPGAISGQTTGVCANTSGTYSISPVVAATGYVWSTTGDITVSSGQGTTAATFSFGPGFTTGTVRVQAENACGLSAVKSLTISSKPGTPGAMAGVKSGITPGTSGEVYSVANVAGVTYYWETTGGISIASGQGTNAVSVDFPNEFTSGIIRVQAQNACGESAFRSATISGAPFSLWSNDTWEDASLSDDLPFEGQKWNNLSLGLSIYPNPTKGQLTVFAQGESSTNQVWLNVFDLSGKQLISMDWSANVNGIQVLDLSSYPAGMYLVQIMTGNEVITEKVVKQ